MRARDARFSPLPCGEQLQIELHDLRFESVTRLIQLQSVNQHRVDEQLTDLGVTRQPWRIN